MVSRNTPEEAAENVASVASVPLEVLPNGPARDALSAVASAGYDVYCYASGGETYGTWCGWLGPLADVRFDRAGRVPLALWLEHWRELLAEAGLSQRQEAQP